MDRKNRWIRNSGRVDISTNTVQVFSFSCNLVRTLLSSLSNPGRTSLSDPILMLLSQSLTFQISEYDERIY